MKVLKFFTHQNKSHDDPLYHLGFEKYENVCGDFYLMLGDVYSAILTHNYDDKNKIVLSLEEPNFCTAGHHVETFNKCSKILTICPYTAETIENRQFVFFPFNSDLIPQKQEKLYDIIYSGSIQSNFVSEIINCMVPYNYIFVSFNKDFRANHPKVSYLEKLNLYSKTKITVCHNLLWPSSLDIPRYRQFLNADKNKAFDLLDQCIMPQIKSRVFEAAFCRSLILCAKDHWNVIEKFFEPEKEFIYYTDINDLQDKLKYIINNFEKYELIIENAFNKAVNNYTTEKFVEKYLK
jgi:hypothetical protein